MTRVSVPNRAYLGDMERFLRLIEDDNAKDLTFHPRDGLFSVHPLVMCILGALSDRARADGGSVLIDDFTQNSSMRYLQRMRLFEHMGVDVDLPVLEHDPAGRFIPLTRITNNSELTAFVTDFVPLLHASPGEADSVRYVLYELVRNVLEHAGTGKTGALAAAQVTGSGRLLIGVADAGIGVRKSIARSHPVRDDRHAIELAFRPGLTGTTSNFGGNETNGGAGLFFMKAMASLARHHMVMVSGNQMMKLLRQPASKQAEIKSDLSDDRVRWVPLETPFLGTAVGIDITVNDTLAFGQLLREIGSVYHVNVRKSKNKRVKAVFS